MARHFAEVQRVCRGHRGAAVPKDGGQAKNLDLQRATRTRRACAQWISKLYRRRAQRVWRLHYTRELLQPAKAQDATISTVSLSHLRRVERHEDGQRVIHTRVCVNNHLARHCKWRAKATFM
jgi:hypothetical protein